MDIQKQREEFENSPLFSMYMDKVERNGNKYKPIHYKDHDYAQIMTFSWLAWQQAQKVVVPEWISVDEKLPEYGCRVLVFGGESVDICTYAKACEQYPDAFWFDGFGSEHSKVTHWQPLPKLPSAQDSTND